MWNLSTPPNDETGRKLDRARSSATNCTRNQQGRGKDCRRQTYLLSRPAELRCRPLRHLAFTMPPACDHMRAASDTSWSDRPTDIDVSRESLSIYWTHAVTRGGPCDFDEKAEVTTPDIWLELFLNRLHTVRYWSRDQFD